MKGESDDTSHDLWASMIEVVLISKHIQTSEEEERDKKHKKSMGTKIAQAIVKE